MIHKLGTWSVKTDDRPIIIAGPCSAETEKQVLLTAHAVKQAGVNLFRAGVWKPRTRPGNFEGIGKPALPWLQKVQNEVGLPVAIEVATSAHVEEALRAGIDVIWIGARTTVNPFAVQDIADALRGTNIPVLVKNPVNPDLSLWLGAIERLVKASVMRIGAVHRGVSPANKSIYRNDPDWSMVEALKKHFPEMLCITDPSHMSGNRELIESISRQALDIGTDGLMIETHINPDSAWSDAKQQITPARLNEMLLRLYNATAETPVHEPGNLSELRGTINYIDDQLIELLAYRMNVAEYIAAVKLRDKMPPLQEDRWRQLLQHHVEMGMMRNLPSDFIETIFNTVHEASLNKQRNIIGKS